MTGPSGLNEFYGSENQLRRYHSLYLPYLDGTSGGLPILDLGCGSGIFLELVREWGRQAVGVEPADEAVAICRAKNLQVIQEDALNYLTHVQREYAGVYCCHLIEHFGYKDACRLLDLCFKALVPGGRLIVVTPNPASLEVISETFWLDPTHVRPYPLPLLIRMLERAGYAMKASGQRTAPGLPRRGIPRRLLLRLLLGRHYGKMDSFLVAEKPVHSSN